MKASELKKKYLAFFKSKKHAVIDSAPLIPEHDPTVLFTTAGMHPLVPFIMGEKHPLGSRIANVQKCLRTGDIDEVGDFFHHTFFEMLGNWSFGDYFKSEAIEMSFEFLVSVLKLDLNRLAVSCFKGDKAAPKDTESYEKWRELGVAKERIAFLGKEDNWWGPAGATGPCGPSTEMFYWVGKGKAPKKFDAGNEKWVEIWNDVFMEYNKQEDGSFVPLERLSVDTGMGVERTAAVLQGLDDNYKTELFWPLIEEIEKLTKKKYEKEKEKMRVVADHIRAVVFILGDERGVVPSNVDQGYILRRFIRRVIRHLRSLCGCVEKVELLGLAKKVIGTYKGEYPILKKKEEFILSELKSEEGKFLRTLEKGLRKFEKMCSDKKIDAKEAFLLFQSYGFPIEMTAELAKERKVSVDVAGFRREYEQHQELSRVGAEKKFKGGLSEASGETAKLHTATHLLNEALRRVLKENIKQRGSNITPERLRFDFNFERKLTDSELRAVEKEVNKQIKAKLSVVREEMSCEEALKVAHGEFGAKYPDRVSVFTIGKDYSKEICMGPHVDNTGELGRFKIKKEESSSAGVRRIKAVLE